MNSIITNLIGAQNNLYKEYRNCKTNYINEIAKKPANSNTSSSAIVENSVKRQ